MPRATTTKSLALVIALLAPFAACERAPRPQPNVVLITIDTLRPDRLSCYGYRKHETPHVDRLAREGVLFENAFCDVTWTTPSMASVMTGQYPMGHGFQSTQIHKLGPEKVTLAEVLRDRGYATAAVVGSFPLHRRYALDQGFEHYDDRLPHKVLNWRPDDQVTGAAAAWLRQNRRRPFLLWVHYFGPHEKPVEKSIEAGWKLHVNGYDAEVVRTDGEVGRLLAVLDELAIADDTLVVFHADHGEALFEHGHVGHGAFLDDTTLRIPLVLRYPGVVSEGLSVRRLVRNIDIFPTILDVLGIDLENDVAGASLAPFVRRRLFAPQDEGETYAETYLPAHEFFAPAFELPDGSKRKVGMVRRGIRTLRWKLVRSEPIPMFGPAGKSHAELPDGFLRSLHTEELYDMAADPGETRNLIETHPGVADGLRRKLDAYIVDQGTASRPVAHFDEATEERFRALGYESKEPLVNP